MGVASAREPGTRKYTVSMILSSGSSGAANAPAMLVLWVPSALALVAYAAAMLWRDESSGPWPHRLLFAGWVAHGVATAIDMAGFGSAVSGARFGFAPALSATLWLVVAVYAVESRWVPLPGARRTLAGLGLIAVGLAMVFPGEFRPQAASSWAPLHWVLGIASYGLFGAAVLHAVMLDRAERQMRLRTTVGAGMPLLRLERLTFQFVTAGFVLLTATLVLGWWFSRPWHWDHKSVFSVLAWLVFACLLMGRQTFGWRGRRAVRGLYAGVVLLLLAYAGSRFVLEVLLKRPIA
jgi:ABC-type uncharacterized transport system permease subunit